MRRVEKEKSAELPGTHDRKDWTGKFLACDFTRCKRILWVYECEQGISLGCRRDVLHLRLRLLRFQLRESSQITGCGKAQRQAIAAPLPLTK